MEEKKLIKLGGGEGEAGEKALASIAVIGTQIKKVPISPGTEIGNVQGNWG